MLSMGPAGMWRSGPLGSADPQLSARVLCSSGAVGPVSRRQTISAWCHKQHPALQLQGWGWERRGWNKVGPLFKLSIHIHIPHYQKGDSVGMGKSHRLGSLGCRFWDANQHAGDLFGNALGNDICGRKRWQVGLSRERSSLGCCPSKGLSWPHWELERTLRNCPELEAEACVLRGGGVVVSVCQASILPTLSGHWIWLHWKKTWLWVRSFSLREAILKDG